MDANGGGRAVTRGRIAWIPMAGGISAAFFAAEWLRRAGEDAGRPVPAGPAVAGFAAAVLLAALAARLASRETRPPPAPEGARGPLSGARALAFLGLGLAAAALFAATWILQGRVPTPLGAIGTWAGAVVLGGAAAVAAFPERAAPGRRAFPPAAGALALLLVLAGWARLVRLDRIPSGFGGDEANQVQDALGLLDGTSPGDPFGVGWYGTMRLGMLPAGLGALAFRNPVAGPRFPYAVVGTVSVAAAAAAAWCVAGGWAAVAAAALLAAAPHHVHFSRLASVMILDALLAALFVLALLRVRGSGSPRWGFFAGMLAGLALYGYSAGRLLPLLLAGSAPFLVAGRSAAGRRATLAASIGVGFLLAATPNLRFAAGHFAEWNSRFNQVAIFRPEWWGPEVARLGSARRVLEQQVVAGTVGLLSRQTQSSWFTGYPIVSPAVLPALAAAGLGWLAGRRRFFAASVLGLLAAGNVAAVIATDTAPSPQRLSSLFPALAILGGVAVAALASLLAAAWPAVRRVAPAALVLALLPAAVPGLPPWWDPSPKYGGDAAALVLAASRALDAPRFRETRILLDGIPYLDSSFPSFPYLLPRRPFANRDPAGDRDGPPPGLHLVPWEWFPLARQWRERYGLRAAAIADPRDPRRDIAWLLRVP